MDEDMRRLMGQWQRNADKAILSGTTWLTADEVGSQVHAWEAGGRIFSIQHEGTKLYPRYAFDADMQPWPVLAEILALQRDVSDPWDLAAWFESSNAYLQPARPKDVLANTELALRAATNINNMGYG